MNKNMNKETKTIKFPLVTIITPAYNRYDLIEETIVSILSQDYPNFEYIVINDGSTDKTLEVIKKYKDKIKIISHENIGETRTVNRGFDLANGEIIGVVNSDDPLLPNAISTMVNFMVKNPHILVVYPDWIMIDGEGKEIERINTYEYSYINMIRWHHCMPGPGALFRKTLLEKINGRDPKFKYVGDFDFWLRAGLLGSFARIPKFLATFRVHKNSASISQTGVKMSNEHVALVKKIFSRINNKELLAIKKESFSSAYYIAAVVMGENVPLLKAKYFLLSFFYCPLKHFSEYKNRLVVILGWIKFKIRANILIKKILCIKSH